MKVIKSTIKKTFAVGVSKKKVRDKIEIELPTEYEMPDVNLRDFSLLIHGEKKIGKTTLAMQGGRVLVLQFDPSQRCYKRLEVVLHSWQEFLAVLKKLEKAPANMYDRIVIDGTEIWYGMCQKFVCENLGIEHPGDEDFGKGWQALRDAFTTAVTRTLHLPYGVWFLAHSQWKEVKNRHGKKTDKLVPRLPSQAEEVLNGRVDGWFAYDYEAGDRVLILMGDEMTGAGHRMDSADAAHFRSKAGNRIRYIKVGNSPQEAYARLESAFNNTLRNRFLVTEDEDLLQEEETEADRPRRKKSLLKKKGRSNG